MIKKLNQKLKTINNENATKNKLNENKSNNSTTVGVAYYATRNAITLIALVITIIISYDNIKKCWYNKVSAPLTF